MASYEEEPPVTLTAGDIRAHFVPEGSGWKVIEGLPDDAVLPPFPTGVSDAAIDVLRTLGETMGIGRDELRQRTREAPPTNAFLVRRCIELGILPPGADEGLERPHDGPHQLIPELP